MSNDDIEIGISGVDRLTPVLENLTKEVAKMSRRVNSGLESIADELAKVADVGKVMGGGIAEGAQKGVQELKKLEQQIEKTANISSTKLTRFGPKVESIIPEPKNVQLTQYGSKVAEAEKRATEELRKQAELEKERQKRIEQFVRLKTEEAEKARAVASLDRQRQQALRDQLREAERQARVESDKLERLAIANTLRLGETQRIKEAGVEQKKFVADIERVTPAIKSAVSELPRLRYALFDVSRGFAILGASLAALVVAPASLAINYRREFADVQRTTGLVGDELEALRQDFIDLKQQVPVSWKDITDIGTLAGQLGIAGNLIASFTESVARFSATTDLNAEQSAVLFGRLNQLISGVDGRFEQLGASINKVGTISVATESQIGQISQNIASTANLAGFAADEVVGLAGALASLNIRPELARGNIQRVFSTINSAIATGGRRLEEFGRLTNRTAEDFARAWRENAADTFVEILKGLNTEGVRMERTLRDIGIGATRDLESLNRLAQNYGVVETLIRESRIAFEEGTESLVQYNTISSTVAEQLVRLGQNFQLLLAIIGDGANAFGDIIELANRFLIALQNLARNEFATTFFVVVGAIIAAGAALALLISGLATLGAKTAGAITALVGFNKQLLATGTSATVAEMGMKKYTLSVIRAAASTQLFRRALGGLAVISAIGAIAAVTSALINRYSESTRSAGDAARAAFGDITSFQDAVAQDTAVYRETGRAIAVRTSATIQDTKAINEATDATNKFSDAQKGAKPPVDELTDSLLDQESAFGDAAVRVAAEYVEGLESFKQIASSPEAAAVLEDIGFSFRELIEKSFEGVGEEYAVQAISEIRRAIDSINLELTEIENIARFEGGLTEEQRKRYQELTDQAAIYARGLSVLQGNLRNTGKDLDTLTGAALDARRGVGLLGDAIGELEGEITFTSAAINQFMEDLFGAENRLKAAEDALFSLGSAFAESGEEALFASDNIQSVVQTIITEAGDASTAAENLGAFLAYLASVGIDITGPALEFVREAIFRLGEQAGLELPKINALASGLAAIGDVNIDFTRFSKGFESVGASAKKAGGQVKTFESQINDLMNTMFASINAAQAASDAIYKLGEEYVQSGANAFYASQTMQTAIRNILLSSGDGQTAVANLSALLAQLANTVGSSTHPSLQILRQTIYAVGEQFGIARSQVEAFIASAGAGLATVGMGAFRRGMRDARRQIEEATKKVRTLVDYANDLSRVITRAFDIRFKAALNLDNIADTWDRLNKEVIEARNNLLKLSADRSVKEYFLSIAEAYGDTLRADVLKAELAELDEEIARNIAVSTRETEGNTVEARENRRVLSGLVREYQDYIVSLAESGASQDELRTETARARREFEEMARSLGFQESAIQKYAVAFDDVTFAINNVPRNVTIEADANPALTALRELQAELDRSIQKANDLNRALNRPVSVPSSGGSSGSSSGSSGSSAANAAQKNELIQLRNRLQRDLNSLVSERTRQRALANNSSNPTQVRQQAQSRIASLNSQIRSLENQINNLNNQIARLAQGGLVQGRGGPTEDKVPAMLSPGEYVVKAAAVRKFGVPFFDELNQMRTPQFLGQPIAVAGGNAGGTTVVELSPYDRKLLADAGNIELRLDGRVLAANSNANSLNASQRGTN